MNRRPEVLESEFARRRDEALDMLSSRIPFVRFLGMRFELKGDEITSVLPFREILLGNPDPPALHGGATAAFMEVTALIELSWVFASDLGGAIPAERESTRLPKTIGFTADYLRPGDPKRSYARANVVRSGRRFATVRVEAWQDQRSRLFAQATGHFLMPQ